MTDKKRRLAKLRKDLTPRPPTPSKVIRVPAGADFEAYADAEAARRSAILEDLGVRVGGFLVVPEPASDAEWDAEQDSPRPEHEGARL